MSTKVKYVNTAGSSIGKVTEYGVSLDDYKTLSGSSRKTAATSQGLVTTEATKTYKVDTDAYRQAQLDWMNGNAAFDGWTDDDKSNFLDTVQSKGLTGNAATAAQLAQSYAIGVRNSNQRAQQDRDDMLAEIEAYKAGYSNEAISTALAQERQALDTKIKETLDTAVNQAAAQGRVIDNTTYAILRGRLEAQAANALQQTQMQYEEKRQEYAYQAMQMKNDVYKNSQDTMMTTQELQSLISSLAGK